MKKVFEWIFENWIVVFGLLIIIGYFVFVTNVASSNFAKQWYSKPINSINLGDVLVLVLLHAFINRTEIKK